MATIHQWYIMWDRIVCFSGSTVEDRRTLEQSMHTCCVSVSCACTSQIPGGPSVFSQLHQTLPQQAKPSIISLHTMRVTPYLADILMVISCVFLEQEELIPHPSTLGPLENSPITVWHPKQISNIPRCERQGRTGPQDREHQKEQNLIGYHGIQSAGECSWGLRC